jgi:hypothetical protein
MKPAAAITLKQALAYFEEACGDGTGTLPKDGAARRAHGILMDLLPFKEFLRYVGEPTES